MWTNTTITSSSSSYTTAVSKGSVAMTSAYSGNSDDEATVTPDIESDYMGVIEALETFVTAYNDVISTIKSTTTTSGTIGSDSTLQSLSSTLKNILSGTVDNDGMYNLLSQIGISTSSSDISNISIDTTTLEEALSENLYSVKLLLSDGYTSKTDNGVFDKLASALTSILDSDTGYFANIEDSLESQISTMNDRITAANEKLTAYETRITEKFNKTDSALSTLSTQLSVFQSYFS